MSETNETPLNLDVPEHLEYSEEHVWVDASVEPAMVGLTEYAVSQLGELVFVDLPEPGIRVEAGDEIVELESQKAVQPLVCPVAGTVRYVNRDHHQRPVRRGLDSEDRTRRRRARAAHRRGVRQTRQVIVSRASAVRLHRNIVWV